MKKKTFFTTQFMFLLFFNGAVLLLSVMLWKEKLEVQKEMALSEHYMILSSVMRDMQAEGGDGYDAAKLMEPYTRYRKDKRRALFLYRGEQLLYSDVDDRDNFDMEKTAAAEEGMRRIRTDGLFLYVEGKFPQPWDDYILVYRYDLRQMYENWRKLKNTLFLGGSGCSLLLSLCLLTLLNRLFAPLQQIAATSRSIASGDLQGRLPEKGKDEVAAMAKSFNEMASTIQRQIAALQEAAEEKQRLVDNFAHELRTPLTAIYGYGEYLQKAAVTEEDKVACAGYIMSECRRLSNLSRQLLELAALRGEDIAWEPVPVERLMETVEYTVRAKAEKRGITMTFQAELDVLKGNPELLESLLINLIDNGIKACESGGCVQVKAYRDGEKAVLSVSDNGRGIPPEELGRVREAFYRVDKARSRKEGGAGLGLSLCEQIADIHQAVMELDSIPQKGTTVRIVFPFEAG